MRLPYWVTFLQLYPVFLVFITEIRTEFKESDGNFIKIRVTNASTPINLPADRCTPTIPKSESGHIYGIETNRICINIYSGLDCSGPFVRYQPSRIFSFLYNFAAHRWNGDVLVDEEHVQLGSIGPCLDKCDARNWAGMETESDLRITLFRNEDYKGTPFTTTITKECTPTPGYRDTEWDSIKISGTQSCIELHEDSNCEGNSVQLRPGHPHLHDLWWYGFIPSNRANFVKAVTLCGAFCPAGMAPVSTSTSTTPVPVTTTRSTIASTITTTRTTTTLVTTPEPTSVKSVSNLSPSVTPLTTKEEEEASDSFPWVLCLAIVLALLSVFCLGAFIYRRYSRSDSSSRFNVEYKIQSDA